ncbi:MAG: hypothetical protein KGD73_00680 [Candidatus Lokiarchaeota archaeon]|nr:hypothetical protein [Candidatus Lokiarchaeota archaeon]
MPKKIEELNLKTFQKLVDQVNKLAEENVEMKKKLEIEIKDVNEKLEYRAKKNEDEITRETVEIKKMIHTTQDTIEETIKVQEEIIMDMIKKFNEEFYKHKSNVLGDIDTIKNKQDILKISYTVNEAKLLDTIKSVINKEISNKIKGQESEALMRIWIEEFKDIIKKFEKIKNLQPQDFNARLDELSNIINSFKQKIQL